MDKAGEREIIERAFAGLPAYIVQTEQPNDRTDGLVRVQHGDDFVVEVKDRTKPYSYIAGLGGPLVDTGKAEAVAERARALGARPVIIWRTSDGWLIGADARDILDYGTVDPSYQRLAGNRPQDVPKRASTLSMDWCYTRPPDDTPGDGRAERTWTDWLGLPDD